MITKIARRVHDSVTYRLHRAYRRLQIGDRLPALVRMPWGVVMVAWPDVMGQFLRTNQTSSGAPFEVGERRFLLKFLQPGMKVLDVGAHDGLYTLLASRRVGASGRVYAFEPSSRERRRLRANLWINHCGNVVIIPKAVGNQSGEAQLHICQGRETGCNSLRPPTVDDPVQILTVPLTTLDSCLDEWDLTQVDLVKMDIEGAELAALQGGKRLLEDLRPVMMIEMEDLRTRNWGNSCRDVYNLVRDTGYSWFGVADDGSLFPVGEKDYYSENLFAVPNEKVSQIA